MRFGRHLALLVALATLFPAPFADAQEGRQGRTGFLVDRLKYPPRAGVSDDPRVRMNAALALGQSEDEAAVEPLCAALEGEPSELVRQAVAAALKRLNKSSGLGCLKARSGSETNAAVKLQISRAIASLETSDSGSSSGKPSASDEPWTPKLNAKAKYYVSISPVANGTDRGREEVQKIVLDAIRSKLEAAGPFQIAPDNETPAAAKGVVAKRKMTGYHLAVAVESFDYTGGDLRVKIKCAVFSYPNKSLKAHFTPGAQQRGVKKGDRGAEDNLLSIVAGAAVDQFAQSVDQIALASP